jgi:SHAQKYF class myb-like DNA-binding protein
MGSHPALVSSMDPSTNSVVPDLMRIYESLTGGGGANVPQQLRNESSSISTLGGVPFHLDPSDAQGFSAGFYSTEHERAESPYYPCGWTYDTTSIPIPPVPENALAAMAVAAGSVSTNYEPTSNTQQRSVSSPPREEGVSSSSSSSAATNIVKSRTLRKRSIPAASAEKEDESDEQPQHDHKQPRRKHKDTDGRWSKRFTWPEDLHHDFVSAIFDVGLKHASPSSILEFMPRGEQITSERVKSHLQKYRMHRAKSKKEFLTAYSETLSRMQKEGTSGIRSLCGGEVAGHAAYATLTSNEEFTGDSKDDTPLDEVEGAANAEGTRGSYTIKRKSPTTAFRPAEPPQDTLVFPRLTDEEKRSPIGSSMGYLMGLFFTLSQQLKIERERKAALEAASVAEATHSESVPLTDVYKSFVHDHTPAQQQQQQQTAAYDVSGTTSGSPKPSGVLISAPLLLRTNLEKSNTMKREMEMQMAFQNKMRALKQQELEKSRTQTVASFVDTDGGVLTSGQGPFVHHHHHQQQHRRQASATGDYGGTTGDADLGSTAAAYSFSSYATNEHPNSYQPEAPPGEHEGAERTIPRGLSIGVSDDFWNTDVVDEQLFEFLMDN